MTFGTNNVFRSDLPKQYGIVESSQIVYPKEMIIATLRDFFSTDSYYHYVRDVWGFANTTDHTDVPLDAGLHDNVTTRLFIGENYRYDAIFYPALLVKSGGTKYVPLSINRETAKVQWAFRSFEDGYNTKIYRYPEHYVFNGIWEGSVVIDVFTRSLRSRDDLVELVSIYFTQLGFESLKRAGIVVKPLSVSSPSETDDRNDKLFRQTITLDIRSEWEVHQPINNIIDVINFAVEFANPDGLVDPNLVINTEYTLQDALNSKQPTLVEVMNPL